VAEVPLDDPEFRRWRAAADRALAASTAQRAANIHEWACFLAEQSAQLGMKALLHGVGAEAWGHDLAALTARAAELVGEPWPADAGRRAERLSRFYVPTRYPDAVPGGIPGDRYDAEDAVAAAEDAHALLSAVDRAWTALQQEP
jgi:HEPN domain-containing protein